MSAVVTKFRRDRNSRVEIAWRTANFIGAGDKLPPLKKFLINTETGDELDKSTLSGSHVDADLGLEAWFNILPKL